MDHDRTTVRKVTFNHQHLIKYKVKSKDCQAPRATGRVFMTTEPIGAIPDLPHRTASLGSSAQRIQPQIYI